MSSKWHIKIPSKHIGGAWVLQVYNDDCERYISSVFSTGVLSNTAVYVDDVFGKSRQVKVKSLAPEIREALEAACAVSALMEEAEG